MIKRPDWIEPIAVLGYGAEGQSTLGHLLRWGFKAIAVLDKVVPPKPLPSGVKGHFGADYLLGLGEAKTAIRSPGVRPLQVEIDEFLARGGFLTSQTEAVFALVGWERIIGVTGTLGKGTCCSLLSAMLVRGGIPHRLAGNIGLPPLDAAAELQKKEWLLLELSSFQLSTLGKSPRAAIVLKTTVEHLDWHASRDEYREHKSQLTRHQSPGDFCVYYADAEGSAFIGAQGDGRKISVGRNGTVRLNDVEASWPERGFNLKLRETRLLGTFNLENLAAAAAAALELGVSPETVCAAARDFAPLEHRLEFVRRIGEVSYYNDSYATRPEAALGAVRALRGAPLGLILGGSEKFADFSELAAGLAAEGQLLAVALIGQTASRLKADLETTGTGGAPRICGSLEEALGFLRSEIRCGSILLSPACASFGLFANYRERGLAFKRLVMALPAL